MSRKLDLDQLRRAKANQFNPDTVVKPIKKEVREPKKAVIASSKPKKAGRPIDKNKKPTKATSIRIHPDLVEVPKILAGLTRKNVFSVYNEIIIDALKKYQKKYPGLLDDIEVPPKGEI
jgi:hypothetical protein